MNDLSRQRQRVNDWMAGNQATFSVMHQGHVERSAAPYDPIPLVLSAEEFTHLEQGLIQRICALNLFLGDIYSNRMIVRDGVIPEEFVYSSPEFQPFCMGLKPVKALYNHITATDLVKDTSGQWYVMQDNLAVPRGAAYPHFARKLSRAVSPETYEVPGLCDNCGLDILLSQLYQDLAQGLQNNDGITVILKAGEQTNANFELGYLSELTGAVFAAPEDLTVMEDAVYYRSPEGGGFQKVAVIHRQTHDSDLDPLVFDLNSTMGVPHLMEAYRHGRVAIVNAPGCGIADDRGLNYFVPQMIRYYLDEEPILQNVPTWLPWYDDQRKYILEHIDELLIKDISGDLSNGSIQVSTLTAQGRNAIKEKLLRYPRRYIAQQIMDIDRQPILSPDGQSQIMARTDLRCFTVHCDSIRVWMGGLSRFSHLDENGQYVSGFKDAWVMSK
jgi:uncharacterized circularly permuted ATP-grasp superfamily protein